MQQHTVVLGLGNILYADEGLGVHAVARLYRHWQFLPQIEIVDGGTQGPRLLEYVERATHLLVLDALLCGQDAPAVTYIHDADVPRYLHSLKVSPHQNSFSEVLALAVLRGTMPAHLVLCGIKPTCLILGHGLSAPVHEGLEHLEAAALEQLARWGVKCFATSPSQSLCATALAL